MAANLFDLPLGELLKNHSAPLSVKSTDSLPTTLNLLVQNKIHAVPVYDEQKKEYTRFVDLLDFSTHIFNIYMENEIIEGDPMRMFQEETRFKVKDIANESGIDPWCDIDIESTLRRAVSLLVQNNLKRIAVVSKGNLINILTLTDIIKFCHEKNLLASVNTLPSTSFHQDDKKLEKMLPTDSTSKAFRLMKQHNINGVAVVDADNKLVGNVSSSDLKHVKFDNTMMPQMRAPIKDFIHSHQKIHSVTTKQTVTDVVEMMASHRVHQIYVVDDQGHAVCSISQIDVLRLISKQFN